MDTETPFPDAIGFSSPKIPDALFSLEFDLIEASDAVRTFSAIVGLCMTPLTGPPIPEFPRARPFRPLSPDVISVNAGVTLGTVDTLLIVDQRCCFGMVGEMVREESSFCGAGEEVMNRKNRLVLSVGLASFVDMSFIGLWTLDFAGCRFEESARACAIWRVWGRDTRGRK